MQRESMGMLWACQLIGATQHEIEYLLEHPEHTQTWLTEANEKLSFDLSWWHGIYFLLTESVMKSESPSALHLEIRTDEGEEAIYDDAMYYTPVQTRMIYETLQRLMQEMFAPEELDRKIANFPQGQGRRDTFRDDVGKIQTFFAQQVDEGKGVVIALG